MPYAEGTVVSAEKSRAEIETTLARYGADSFGYMTDTIRSTVYFQCKGRVIRIQIEKADGAKLKRTGGQSYRYPTDIQRAAWVEGENHRRWRALLLVIKAKLEAIQSGIATFEAEFLPYTVMANGLTVTEWAKEGLPQLAAPQSIAHAPQLTAGGH